MSATESRRAASPQDVAIVFVVAVAENDVIGQAGQLPWRLKSEMAHFRRVTMGKPVVMGRKTYLSIGKPLPGRTNIVVSRDRAFGAPGIVVAPSVATALAAARGDALRRGANEISIIGGADIFDQTLAVADRLLVTRVHLRPKGDTKFPTIDPAVWTQVESAEHQAGQDDEASYTVLVYERAAGAKAAGSAR